MKNRHIEKLKCKVHSSTKRTNKYIRDTYSSKILLDLYLKRIFKTAYSLYYAILFFSVKWKLSRPQWSTSKW